MRVLQVTAVYPPYRGGIGKVAFDYAVGLRKRGIDVEVLTPEYRGRPTSNETGVLWAKPIVELGNAAIISGVSAAVKRADVAHLHYPFFGTDILVALACRRQRKPLIVTYHMKPVAAGIKGKIFDAYRFLFERFVLGSAQDVLVSSFDYAESIGLKISNLNEMPLGVDLKRFI